MHRLPRIAGSECGRPQVLSLALALSVAVASCGGDGGPTEPSSSDPPTIASVEVTPGADTLDALGQEREFSAEVRDQNGDVVADAEVSWSSSDEDVATVDDSGVAEAVGNGTAEIRASAGDVTATGALRVSQRVSAVTVSPGTATLGETGATQQFDATATDANGNEVASTSFLWQSERQSVATVDSAGLATAQGEGETTITAAARGVPGRAVLRVEIGSRLAAVRTGEFSTCGLTVEGDAYCWGANDHGQVGDATDQNRTTPVEVSGGLEFSVVSLGRSHTCGVTTGGAGYCWGWNYAGQLGDGSTTERHTPVAVDTDLAFTTVTAGGGFPVGSHTCALTDGGDAHCWGENAGGQLGDGTTDDRPTPVAVSGSRSFGTITAGGAHTCALTDAGAAYCWGSNGRGQLGDGTTDPRDTPAAVDGGLRFESLSAGRYHTCAVYEAGGAYCWGWNGAGQLGDGTDQNRTAPVAVGGGLTFETVTAGGEHTCALTTGGRAYCWGRNVNGALGDGTTTDRTGPVAVRGGLEFTDVWAGEFHTCGVARDGTAYCWGLNAYGSVGDGTTGKSLVPVPVRFP